jgi:preprotein translocase subunit YajC
MDFLYFFLQCTPGANGKDAGGGTMQLVLIGGMIIVFWLFMIRPQAKKAKLQQQFGNNIEKGTKVVTMAGIHGTISKVNEDGTVQLEVSPGMYIKIEKSTISMEMTNKINNVTTK